MYIQYFYKVNKRMQMVYEITRKVYEINFAIVYLRPIVKT